MSATDPETSDLTDLLALLDDDAMEAIGRCRGQFRASLKAHHQTVYYTIAFLAGFVLRLEGSDEDRRSFLEDPYWADKPHPPKEKNLIRLASLYVVGARESRGAHYQQALQYARVVEYLLAEGVAPAAIPEQLRRTPIYRLLDEIDDEAAGVEMPEPIRPKGSVDEPDHDRDEGGGCASDDDDLGAVDTSDEAGPDQISDGASPRSRPRVRAPMFDAAKHIAVTGLRFQSSILSLKPLEDRWIRIRRVEDEGEVLRFDVLEMERGHEV